MKRQQRDLLSTPPAPRKSEPEGRHLFQSAFGPLVVIRWSALPKRGSLMQVRIEGDDPIRYTTQNDPLEWSQAYEAEDRREYAALLEKNAGAG
jgi:hypothetical protein